MQISPQVPFHQIRSWKGRIRAPVVPAFQRTAVLRPSLRPMPSGCQQECTLSSVLRLGGRHTHRVLLQCLLPLPPQSCHAQQERYIPYR